MANLRKPVTSTVETKRRLQLLDRRDRMSFVEDPKYYRVWINDVKTDISDYLEAGFQFVSERDRWGKTDEGDIEAGTPLDSRAAVNVGRAGGQENVTAYLLQMPREEWQPYVDQKNKEAMEPVREMQRQKDALKQNDGFYGDISIK